LLADFIEYLDEIVTIKVAKSDEKISTILSSMPSTLNYNTKRKFNTLSKVNSIKKLDPFFITGLADAESSFMIFIRKNPKIKVG